MKKKVFFKRTIKIISLLLAVVICSYLLQTFLLCHSDSNRERIKAFYLEKKDTIDVVFVGASEVYCDFASAYAYGKYGFTSYPYVSQGLPMTLYKTAIKEVVSRQHPKLIVIEINGALYGDKHMSNDAYYRYYLDSMPLNRNKIDYIQNNITNDRIEYYAPLIKYHNNWTKFPKGVNWNAAVMLDDLRGYSLLKGVKNETVKYGIDKKDVLNYNKHEKDKRVKLNPQCYEGLIDLLEFCKEENLNVLFTRFPHPITKDELNRPRRANTAGDIVRKYGFEYLNFDHMFNELDIEPGNDFYNSEHMNIYGQQKFTDYLSEYIIKNYGITQTELDEKTKARWDKCAQQYEIYEQMNLDAFENGESVVLGGDLKSTLRALKYKKTK